MDIVGQSKNLTGGSLHAFFDVSISGFATTGCRMLPD